MTSIVLDAETAKIPLELLLQQLNDGGFEVKDSAGKVLAIMLGPVDKEALTYAEARLDFIQNRAQIQRALGRCDGITTSELLAKALEAGNKADER